MHFLAPLLTRPAATGPLRLFVEGREEPLATTLETAFDSVSRTKGLLGRESLADGSALVIAPCSAIHTFSMRFPIDVVFARRDGRVVKLRRGMGAGRIAAALRAFAVIEFGAGALDRAGVQVGDRLVVR